MPLCIQNMLQEKLFVRSCLCFKYLLASGYHIELLIHNSFNVVDAIVTVKNYAYITLHIHCSEKYVNNSFMLI